MDTHSQPSTPNETWLDELFVRFVDALKAGEPLDLTPAIRARPDREDDIRRLCGVAEALVGERPRVPLSIPGLEVVAQLGAGGMGIVYLAEQRGPVRRRVAIKVMRPGLDTGHALRRFEAERQALAIMEHDAIAKIFDAGCTEDGRLYYVMEYVAGVPLNRYCDEHRLTVRQRLDLVRQVCAGIHHAHTKGIIHRDIKPANVLVAIQGDRPVPKIIDFGVARAADHRLTERPLFTEEGMLLGTFEYMSPEQTFGPGVELDARSDVYALGVLLYELLCGSLPFPSNELRRLDLAEMQRVIREVDAPPLSVRARRAGPEIAAARGVSTAKELVRALRGDLDWITARAMEKDRRRRYGSAMDLAEDLGRNLRGEVVLAGAPSIVYRARKLLRRNRVRFAFAAAVLTVASIAGSIAWRAWQENERLRVSDAADDADLRELEAEADQLWPELPAAIGRLEEWLRRARALAPHVSVHEDNLAELRRRDPEAMDAGALARERLLAELVEKLEAFLAPGTGLLARIEQRLAHATAAQRTVVAADAADRWRHAIEDIANHGYGGLRLTPQVGLVPLHRDGRSGLWEFAHPRTGSLPERAGGELRIAEDTGLVFVLVPAGEFWMGAQSDDPAGRQYDPHARSREAPPHRRSVEAFFLSKWEMTRAQWRRAFGDPGATSDDGNGLLPAEGMEWASATEHLARIGLSLPTEAQWEFACRAKTEQPGPAEAALVGRANLGSPFADDWKGPSPVGRFPANAFGLHDMLGNVAEWCRGPFADYPSALGDASAPDREGLSIGMRVARGGSHALPPRDARFSSRLVVGARTTSSHIGLRPTREVDR